MTLKIVCQLKLTKKNFYPRNEKITSRKIVKIVAIYTKKEHHNLGGLESLNN